jgi:hypothetical protein
MLPELHFGRDRDRRGVQQRLRMRRKTSTPSLHFDFSVRFARKKSLTRENLARLQPAVPATMSVEKARRRTHSKNSGDLFARFINGLIALPCPVSGGRAFPPPLSSNRRRAR